MKIDIDIRKFFPGFSLDLSFSSGENRLGILGSSGCGKSMTLKCIAGIERPDSGRIVLDGKTVFDSAKRISLKPQERRAGYLFQNYALFPSMNIRENLSIVIPKTAACEKRKLVDEILARFRLEGLADLRPRQLSGGQQQRAALARMILTKPEIILLDEPFSALDTFLREQVEAELAEILAEYQGTVILVSHNRDEVFRMCDEMLVIDGGRISVSGKKDELFRNPLTVAAARLTGCKNIAPALKAGSRRVAVPSWGLILETNDTVPDSITHVGMRAHCIRTPRDNDYVNCFDFVRTSYSAAPFTSTEYLLSLTPPGYAAGMGIKRERLCRVLSSPPDAESRIKLCLPAEHILLLTK